MGERVSRGGVQEDEGAPNTSPPGAHPIHTHGPFSRPWLLLCQVLAAIPGSGSGWAGSPPQASESEVLTEWQCGSAKTTWGRKDYRPCYLSAL